MKKLIAEFIGTAVLVTMGCGTAMLVGCNAANGGGYILTALAFGLVIVGMAYCVGNISGCHINPAVSLGVLMSGGMKTKEFFGYVISQCLGALAGAGILAAIFNLGNVTDMTGGFGSNGLARSCFNLYLCNDHFGRYQQKGRSRFFRRSYHRFNPYFGTYPRYWLNRYLRKPRKKYRSRYRSCYFRQYHSYRLCMGIYCRTFCRCSAGSNRI